MTFKPFVTMIVSFALLGSLIACAPWLDTFLNEATNKGTQEDVRQRLGQPSSTHPLEDGGELWAYRMAQASYAGGAGRTNCFEYRLNFDKEKILRKWDQRGCKDK